MGERCLALGNEEQLWSPGGMLRVAERDHPEIPAYEPTSVGEPLSFESYRGFECGSPDASYAFGYAAGSGDAP